MGMEINSSSFPNSSTSSNAKWKYDIFLSFKGEDTRYNFMSHLYEVLTQKGIATFKDDVKLERGESISQELSKAIEESRFAVVILSKNYAFSTWCLEELAKIVGCKKEKGMTILPVFHYVDPSDIRNQKGAFEQAFIKHEETGNKENVEKWRNALREVGNLAGWHLKNTRSEMEDIKDIVGIISLKLKYDAIPYMTKNLVGIYSRMAEFESRLAIDSNNVLFIGIRGMGGMGKTTLAKVVYYMVFEKFESCRFIENVRENSEKEGLLSLQQKLICDILEEKNFKIRGPDDGVIKIMNTFPQKKILLVLDDVDKLEQLQMLAKEHDWFGPGSRIIITSRNVALLNTHGVDDVYEVEGLKYEDALQLFCLKAFKKENVPNDYLELSKDFLKHANGHPLTLEVLGSSLFGKTTDEWESALQRLKEFPEAEVLRVLRISYDTLREVEKEIFLHIACFFNHDMKDRVVEILDILDLHPIIGLRKLIDMSLLKITTGGVLWMHDLLEEMGRNIVREVFPNDLGKHSRLWRYEEIDNMLEKNEGTEAVQAMDITGTSIDEKSAHWNPEAFLKMHNLKFLRIRNIYHVPTHLPKDLKILEWNQYPSKSLPSSFQLNELIQLCLLNSSIEQLWIGRKNFNKLKFINLANSSNLTITPDFTGVPNLEKLVLEYCTNLCELHPSIGILKKLVFLNLANCRRLSSLPSKLEMDSLQTLDLSCCFILQKIPESVGNLVCLQDLFLVATNIMELPSSIGGLIGLTSLILSECKNLVCLPSTICCLKSLECLDLSYCSNFNNLPENIGNVKGLKKLDLTSTAIKELPSSIEGLTRLTSLTFQECKNLVRIPSTICNLKSLECLVIYDCSSLVNLPENLGNIEGLKELALSGKTIEGLPSSIERLTSLTSLILVGGENLVCLPNTICNLKSLECLKISLCSSLENLPENLGNIKSLKKLGLSEASLKELPSSIERLTSLTSLNLRGCKNLVCLPNTICNLKSLKKLCLSRTAIKELPSSIERLASLTSLNISDCKNLVSLPNTTCGFKFHGYLDLSKCLRFKNLPENPWIIKGLGGLNLSTTAIEEMPSSIGCLTNLTTLNLRCCMNLVRLPSTICSLKSLESLDLYGCLNLENLPENLGNVKGLKELCLRGTAIKELPSSIERLASLTSLNISDCKNLVSLPNTTCGFKFHGALDLSTCFRFKNLPENPWIIKGLGRLDLSTTALEEMPSSIGCLTNLTTLNLRFCMNLVRLPSIICSLKSLESLDLYGCLNLENLPENLGNVKGLKELCLIGTAIKELPSSIERLASLTSLNISDCKNLVSLPNTTCGFKFHGALNLSVCLRFKNLPENPWIIEGLGMLDLSKTAIEEMPSSIGRLTNLTALTLRFCMNLVCLPSTICNLKLLNYLDLLGCLKFENLPENIGNMKDLEVLNLGWTSITEFPSSIVLLKNLKYLYIRRWKLSEFYSQPASRESMDPLWNLSFSQPTSPLECIGLPSFLYSSLPTSPILVGLLMPSLSSLHSLTYLHINDCDLLSIPNDIGCLSSLECLKLSGNNFVSLPESMSQLFNLRRLYLEGCKRLQSLGNVPSTIDSVIANDCSSLEKLAELQFYPYRSDHSYFQCFNCFKLVGYVQNGSNMLQGLPNIVIPGGEIPKWFSHEFQDDNIQLPFPGCDELIGIALCVVFAPNGSHQYHRNWKFMCFFHLNGFQIAEFAQSYFMTKYGTVESPHIWLLYLSTHHSVSNWGKIRSCIDANGFSQLEIKIHAEVVEKIGVRLVYKQDMEDPNQTMAQCINNNSTLYENLGVLCHDVDDSAVESSRNKQSHDLDDGVGPSGEGYSNEEPQPKWIQREFFDLFTREDEMSKKLESIHGGKSDCYQDIEDPNQTITQLCINSRTLYEDLGDRHHDLYNSAAEGSRNKLSHDEEDGAGPSGEGYSNEEPQPKWIQREFFDFFAREDEMFKKLESIHGGKSDCYQDIEDSSQTITQLCINSRMLYEDLGDRHHDLYNSAAEGSRNKLSRDEEDGAGPSGEGYSNKEPELKWIHRVGEFKADYEDSSHREIIDFFAREDQMKKKLESILGGKRDSYQDIEDPNQIITQLSINSRTLHEDLGDRHHDLYDSTLEGSRNKRSRDEDGGAGPNGEGCSSDETPFKDLEDVWLILRNFVQGMFRLFCLRESKKLEAYHSGKREGYKSNGEELATEDPSSQTHLGTC